MNCMNKWRQDITMLTASKFKQNNRQLACQTNFLFRQKNVNFRKELIKISKIAKFGCEML